LEGLELVAFGVFHPDLGARLVEKWFPVPKEAVSSIRKHHFPLSGNTTSFGVLWFINGANENANNHEIHNGIPSYICPMNSHNILKI
jgi:hypothetical protein